MIFKAALFQPHVSQEHYEEVVTSYSLSAENISLHTIPVNYPLLCSGLRCFQDVNYLLFFFPGSYDDEEGPTAKLEWNKDQGQGFAQGGFELVDNKIVIPQTGLYFVYSQASFRVTCNDGDEQGVGRHLTPLSHRIWRDSDSVGTKSSLMSAVRSACQQAAQEDSDREEQGWYNTIYLGAVFQLNRGDKLWTETNQLSELETDDGKTFFGVFAL